MRMTQEEIDKIDNAGYEAFAAGLTREDNPHRKNSKKYLIWLGGFDEVFEKQRWSNGYPSN